MVCRPKLAARLKDPKSGRVLKVLTTAPAMQFYTGNYVEGVHGKAGAVYNQDSGICLETQVSPATSGVAARLQCKSAACLHTSIFAA